MCTIIVRHQMDEWCSTIVASNRDEFYDRAAIGPAVLHSNPLIVGGRDEQEGGTWLGPRVGDNFEEDPDKSEVSVKVDDLNLN